MAADLRERSGDLGTPCPRDWNALHRVLEQPNAALAALAGEVPCPPSEGSLVAAHRPKSSRRRSGVIEVQPASSIFTRSLLADP